MRILTLSAALIAATLPTAAMAADWVLLGLDTSGNTMYIDRDSIRNMPNGHKRAWVRTELGKPFQTGDTGFRLLEEYDCGEGRVRALQSTWFKGADVTFTSNDIGEWSYVGPETNGELALNFVCFGKLG